MVNRKGEEVAERFLWMVCQLVDSVDREHTTLFLRHRLRWATEELIDGKLVKVVQNPKLVFCRKQTEGRHFWRDPHLTASSNLLCSDEAGAAIESANLTAISLRYKETV